MIRGTSHIFRFDCSDIVDDITTVRSFEVIFEQSNNNDLPIIKKFDVYSEGTIIGDSGCNFSYESKEVTVELTPEETILFVEDRKLKVQLKGFTANPDTTFADYIQYVTVYPMLAGQNSRAISGGGNSTYVLPIASSNVLGGVKVNPSISNITMNNGLISVTSENVTEALGYVPADVVETVYVGEEAPDNANIQIWVNPTEEDLSGGSYEGGPTTLIGVAESSSGVNLTNEPKSGTVMLGSAATKFVSSMVQENDGNLITSGAVYDAITQGINYESQTFTSTLNAGVDSLSHMISYDIPRNRIVVARSISLNDGTSAAPVMATVVWNPGYNNSYVYVSRIPGQKSNVDVTYQVQVQMMGV